MSIIYFCSIKANLFSFDIFLVKREITTTYTQNNTMNITLQNQTTVTYTSPGHWQTNTKQKNENLYAERNKY